MGFIEQLKEKARHDRKTIVLPEGMDRRTYEAAEQIVSVGDAVEQIKNALN